MSVERGLLGGMFSITLTAEPAYAQAPLLRLGEPAPGFRSTLARHEKRARKAKNKAQRKARRITRQKP